MKAKSVLIKNNILSVDKKEMEMSKKWLVLIFILSLYMSGIANAAIVTESVYGSLNSTYGNWNATNLEIGAEYHLFDVTFDNEQLYYTVYNTDNEATGSVVSGSAWYAFSSNANFELGDVLITTLDQNQGDDYYVELKSYASSRIYPGFESYRDYEHILSDFRLQTNLDNDVASLSWYATYNGSQTINVVRFDSLRMVPSQASVPVPSSIILLGLGCLSLTGYNRSRKN